MFRFVPANITSALVLVLLSLLRHHDSMPTPSVPCSLQERLKCLNHPSQGSSANYTKGSLLEGLALRITLRLRIADWGGGRWGRGSFCPNRDSKWQHVRSEYVVPYSFDHTTPNVTLHVVTLAASRVKDVGQPGCVAYCT